MTGAALPHESTATSFCLQPLKSRILQHNHSWLRGSAMAARSLKSGNHGELPHRQDCLGFLEGLFRFAHISL